MAVTSFSRAEIMSATKPIVAQRRTVRFQDVDAAGTIYFPRVLEYFGDAYLQVLQQAGLDVPRMLRERTLAAPLAHVEADFLLPLFFGDEIDVEVALARLGKTSVTFGHRIRKGSQVTSVGVTAHVFVDGRTFQPVSVPDALRRVLEA